MSALYFDARIDGAKLQMDIDQINRKMELLSKAAQKHGSEMDKSFQGVGKTADELKGKFGGDLKNAVLGFFALSAGQQLVQSIVKVRGEFQQLEVAFKTMLGNKKEADKLMAQVVQFAAKTPFELSDVASGAKSLLAYGVLSKDIIPTLKSLGDVSAGLSVPMERLILNFGQIKTQGELTGRELRDFSVAGVPMIAELSKNLNKSETEIQSMVSAGKIGFNDVANAFKTMSSEGGRFANMMDAQSQTVTGQISNMKDAWNQMLNEIGKSNEGAMYGAIGITKGLIENYEKIIDTLKILVLAYGSYKAAVIITAAVQNTTAIPALIKNVQAFIGMAKGIRTAAQAQEVFNVVTKASPWGLAISGITVLVAVLGKLAFSTKKAGDYLEDLGKAGEAIDSQVKTDNLVKRYQELDAQTNRSVEQQKEYVSVMNQLGATFPAIIKNVDQYGNVIGIAGDKLEKLNNDLRKSAKATTNESLKDSEAFLKEQVAIRQNYIDKINKGTKTVYLGEYDTTGSEVPLSPKEISRFNKEINRLTGVIDAQAAKVNETKEKMASLGAPEVAEELKKYEDIMGGINKLTDDQAKERKAKLEAALKTALSTGAKEVVQKELDGINALLKTPMNTDQIKDLQAQLITAQKEYDRVNSQTTRSTAEQRKAAAENLQAIKDQLKERGINVDQQSKAEAKAAKEAVKTEKEKQKAIQELKEKELEVRNQTEAAKVAAMADGLEKQLAEARMTYQLELQQIESQKKDLLAKIAETQETDASGKTKVTELSSDQTEMFEKQKAAAAQKYANIRVQIEADANRKIAEIRGAVAEVFISEQDRELLAIETKYKELETALANNEKATGDDWVNLQNAKEKEITQAKVNNAMNQLAFEEEIAIRTIEIQNRGLANAALVEQKKLTIQKQKAKERINELSRLQTKEADQEIQILYKQLEAWEQDFKELSIEAARNVVSAFRDIGGAVGEIDSALGETINNVATLADNAITAFSGFTTGNLVGAITGSIGVVSSLFNILKKDEEPDVLSKTLDRINKNLEIQAGLLASLSGEDWFLLAEKQADEYVKKVLANTKALQDSKIYTKEYYKELQEDFKQLQKDFPNFYGKMQFSTWIENKPDNTNAWDLKQFYDAWANELIYLDDSQKKILSDAYAAIQSQQQLMEEAWDKVTATSRDSIADSIIQGFRDGYKSAEDFAENFEELMRNAVIQALKNDIMAGTGTGSLKQWYEGFYNLSQDGLTPQEIKLLREAYDRMIESQRTLYDNANAIINLGKDAADELEAKTDRGVIKNELTETTGGLILGQFTAMREFQTRSYNSLQALNMTANMQLDGINRANGQLAEIAINTRHNAKLVTMSEQLAEMINVLKTL